MSEIQALNNKRLLNYKQVMALLSCSETAVRNLVKRGDLTRKLYPGVGYRYEYKQVMGYVKEGGI